MVMSRKKDFHAKRKTRALVLGILFRYIAVSFIFCYVSSCNGVFVKIGGWGICIKIYS